MQISIAPELQARWPQTALGVLVYEVQVAPSSPALLARFDQTIAQLAGQFTLDTIAHLPVLRDDLGWFGNPSSDSRRAMIQPGKRQVASVLYAFDGPQGLGPWLAEFAQALEEFCGVTNLQTLLLPRLG